MPSENASLVLAPYIPTAKAGGFTAHLITCVKLVILGFFRSHEIPVFRHSLSSLLFFKNNKETRFRGTSRSPKNESNSLVIQLFMIFGLKKDLKETPSDRQVCVKGSQNSLKIQPVFL